MDKKNRKKKIHRVLLTGAVVLWILRHLRKKSRNRYTISEKHEYYKFLG